MGVYQEWPDWIFHYYNYWRVNEWEGKECGMLSWEEQRHMNHRSSTAIIVPRIEPCGELNPSGEKWEYWLKLLYQWPQFRLYCSIIMAAKIFIDEIYLAKSHDNEPCPHLNTHVDTWLWACKTISVCLTLQMLKKMLISTICFDLMPWRYGDYKITASENAKFLGYNWGAYKNWYYRVQG